MQRRTFALLIASVTVAFLSGSRTASAESKDLKRLTVDQVSAKLAAKDGKTFIFDNNSKDSWTAGHVPGARWLDDEKVTADALPPDQAALLIFYCHNES